MHGYCGSVEDAPDGLVALLGTAFVPTASWRRVRREQPSSLAAISIVEAIDELPRSSDHLVGYEHMAAIAIADELVRRPGTDEGGLHAQDLLDRDGGIIIRMQQKERTSRGMNMA